MMERKTSDARVRARDDGTDRRNWYRVARVRCPGAVPGATERGLAFAPALVPYVDHPTVIERGETARARLLDLALARYLHLTSVLEARVVCRVAGDLAHGALRREISQRARVEAMQIVCDEGFHGALASDLLDRLGVDERDLCEPAFVDRLADLDRDPSHAAVDPDVRRLLFAVVTETAISSTLSTLARAASIGADLRAFVADHAHDEARHGVYFARVFATVWRGWTPAERDQMGTLLPGYIHAFLTPDTHAMHADLCSVGVPHEDAHRVLAASETRDHIAAAVRTGSRPVVACVRRAGGLEGATRHAFASAGLLAEGG